MKRSNCRRVNRLRSMTRPARFGDDYLEALLCEIDRDRHSIHIGLLLVAWCHPQLAAMMPRKNREESMPSLKNPVWEIDS
jgi:hypothetical protein